MSGLILSGNGSYFKGLYVKWDKLKAVMFKIINRCTLDINISIIKVTSVSNFANFRIFGQHSKQPEKNHDIKTTGW